MTSIPTGLPRFSALYKSAEAQRKGDKAVAAASVVGGAGTAAAYSLAPNLPFVAFTLGAGILYEGIFRLFTKRDPVKYPAPLALSSVTTAASSVMAAPGNSVTIGAGSSLVAMALGHIYDDLKGTPEDVKTPEK